jgi:hypothetical protein
MSDFDVKVSGTEATVTHLKYKHKWVFPRTLAPQYVGSPSIYENLRAIADLRVSMPMPERLPCKR